jgi:hypothetical protein
MAQKLPNNQGILNQLLLGYKRSSRDRKQPFELTNEQFYKLVQQPCYYCNTSDSNLKKTVAYPNGFPYNGIDRLNPKIGYTITNSVSCCRDCNFAKQGMTKKQFISWIDKVYSFLKEKKRL